MNYGSMFQVYKGRAKKRVFLSFIAEDRERVNGLRLLASNDDFDIEFYDESVKTPINSTNRTYIEQRILDKIDRSSVTVCLISEETHKSEWVNWELEYSRKKGNAIIAMALKGVERAVLPSEIKGLPFHPWSYESLAQLISSA